MQFLSAPPGGTIRADVASSDQRAESVAASDRLSREKGAASPGGGTSTEVL